MISMHHSIQVVAGEARETDDAVVTEDRFEILLNDRPVTEMVASRDQLRELGAGYVICEGLVRCVDKVTINADRILVYSDTGCDLKWVKRETGSSGGLSFITTPPKNISDIRITPDDVITITKEIETDLWKKTGGVHCSVLFRDMQLLAKSSDVGRHNTVDKLVGYAVLNGIDLSRCVIGCTGRQPAGMVRKRPMQGSLSSSRGRHRPTRGSRWQRQRALPSSGSRGGTGSPSTRILNASFPAAGGKPGGPGA